jgi:hypothetical protein
VCVLVGGGDDLHGPARFQSTDSFVLFSCILTHPYAQLTLETEGEAGEVVHEVGKVATACMWVLCMNG